MLVPNFNEPIGFSLLVFREYEADVLGLILNECPVNGCFVDVGANIGCFSVPVAKKVGELGMVFAIEASPFVFRYLVDNVEINGLRNVNLIHGAASDSDGDSFFYEANRNSFGMGSLSSVNNSEAKVPVKMIRVDSLYEKFQKKIDVMKIDVEGFEYLVLKGSFNLLKLNLVGLIIFEFFDRAESQIPNCKPGDSQRFLRDLGYSIFKLSDYIKGKGPLVDIIEVGFEMLVAKR